MNTEPILHKKSFHELTVDELYELMRARSEVFVVEQNCVYQDLDGDDQQSIHLWLTVADKVVANDDFSDLECDPVLLFKYPYPTIDTDIVRDTDGIFHLFFNTWNQEGLARRQYVFSDIHNPEGWTLLPGRMQPNELASEGSSVYPLIEGGWMMGYDCFRDGKYQFCKSDNLRDFDLVTETTSADEFNPRHGSVLLITDAEMQNLIRHFGK